MIAFKASEPKQSLDVWGPPERLAAVTLEGAPIMHGVHLYGSGEEPLSSGIYEVTKGKFKVVYPFHEHATVLDGEVILSDEEGHSVLYGPGDSWFCHQGEVITWDVQTETLRKSFFVVNAPTHFTVAGSPVKSSGFAKVG